MKYIKDYKDGDRVFDIYLCKHKISAVTKNGKPYDTVVLQDKTGTIDAKVWDPNNAGIAEFDSLDYIEVYGDITSFQGVLQVNVKRIRKCQEGEYAPADYLPVSRFDREEMYQELERLVADAKPASRHLTGLAISLSTTGNIFAGAGCYHGDALTVYPYTPEAIIVGGDYFPASAIHLIDNLRVNA